MAEEKYNLKNPAVKRILQEVKEMQSNPSDDFMSLPLEVGLDGFPPFFDSAAAQTSRLNGSKLQDSNQFIKILAIRKENIFEWQFAIAGPRDSEFEGGIYHGRIQLPSEYPFKPPSFMLLTPNGRFETQTKICLSISNYHPEHWQPSWSVRTALVALIAFMPTNPNGALGSLDYKKEERHKLAIKSRESAPKYGTTERQKLMDEIHEYMLTKAPPVPQIEQPTPEESSPNQENESLDLAAGGGGGSEEEGNREEEGERIEEDVRELHVNAGPLRVSFELSVTRRVQANEQVEQTEEVSRVSQRSDDRLFTWAAIGLTVAIVVLLLKKFLRSNGVEIGSFGGFK